MKNDGGRFCVCSRSEKERNCYINPVAIMCSPAVRFREQEYIHGRSNEHVISPVCSSGFRETTKYNNRSLSSFSSPSKFRGRARKIFSGGIKRTRHTYTFIHTHTRALSPTIHTRTQTQKTDARVYTHARKRREKDTYTYARL